MVFNVEELVDARTAHIAVNQQYSLPQLCQRNCKITCDGGFAFARLRADEGQRTRRSPGRGEQDRRSQAAKGLRERRMLGSVFIDADPGFLRNFLQKSMLSVSVGERRPMFCQPIHARARVVQRFSRGNQGECGHAKEALNVVRVLKSVVQMFLKEGNTDATAQT